MILLKQELWVQNQAGMRNFFMALKMFIIFYLRDSFSNFLPKRIAYFCVSSEKNLLFACTSVEFLFISEILQSTILLSTLLSPVVLPLWQYEQYGNSHFINYIKNWGILATCHILSWERFRLLSCEIWVDGLETSIENRFFE